MLVAAKFLTIAATFVVVVVVVVIIGVVNA